METSRSIVHLDLDTFFVSVERLQNPKLIGKPVIVGGGSDRGVVSACSYEARKYGVHSAMPMRMARSLCPDAFVLRGDMEQYTKYSDVVTDIIAEKAPVYEKASIDEFYIDISGMDRFIGSYQWATSLRADILKHTGLPVSSGLSVNKTVSKMATCEAKPNGEKFVPSNAVIPFIDPLSIRKIPMIGKKTYHLLRSMGVERIETLRKIPINMMLKVLGENGKIIWQRANGVDNTPVQAYWEQKSLSSEHTFEKDSIDVIMMNGLLASMTEKLAFEMREMQKITACVTVKIRYANFDTHTMQKRIPYTSFDHVLIDVVKELFKRLYSRRMLIRLIGIRFSHLVNGAPQLNIFDDVPEKINLYKAIDKMRRRYGYEAVLRAGHLDERL